MSIFVGGLSPSSLQTALRMPFFREVLQGMAESPGYGFPGRRSRCNLNNKNKKNTCQEEYLINLIKSNVEAHCHLIFCTQRDGMLPLILNNFLQRVLEIKAITWITKSSGLQYSVLRVGWEHIPLRRNIKNNSHSSKGPLPNNGSSVQISYTGNCQQKAYRSDFRPSKRTHNGVTLLNYNSNEYNYYYKRTEKIKLIRTSSNL